MKYSLENAAEWIKAHKRPTQPAELVGKQQINTLRMIAECARPVSVAPRQIERLRRAGYVTVQPGDGRGVMDDTAWITEAGRALLARADVPVVKED